MKVLWRLKEAASAQIIEELKEKSKWNPKTMHTLIKRLVNKKAIRSERLNGKYYMYYPNISESNYKTSETESFLKKFYNGSINGMVLNFVKEKKISKDELDKLKKMLNEEEE